MNRPRLQVATLCLCLALMSVMNTAAGAGNTTNSTTAPGNATTTRPLLTTTIASTAPMSTPTPKPTHRGNRTLTQELTQTLTVQLMPPVGIVRLIRPAVHALSLALLSGIELDAATADDAASPPQLVLELNTSAWTLDERQHVQRADREVRYSWDCGALEALRLAGTLLTLVDVNATKLAGRLVAPDLGVIGSATQDLLYSALSSPDNSPITCASAVANRTFGSTPKSSSLRTDALATSRATITLGSEFGMRVRRDIADAIGVGISINLATVTESTSSPMRLYVFDVVQDGLLTLTYDYPNATTPDPAPYLPPVGLIENLLTVLGVAVLVGAFMRRPAALLAFFRARCGLAVSLAAGLRGTSGASDLVPLVLQLLPWEHPGRLQIGGGSLASQAGVTLCATLLVGGGYMLHAGAALAASLCEASPDADAVPAKLLQQVWPDQPVGGAIFRRGAALVRFPFFSVVLWALMLGPAVEAATALVVLAVTTVDVLAAAEGLTAFGNATDTLDNATLLALDAFRNESRRLAQAIDESSMRPQISWVMGSSICLICGCAVVLRYTTTAIAADYVTLEVPPNPFGLTDEDVKEDDLMDVGLLVEYGGGEETPRERDANGDGGASPEPGPMLENPTAVEQLPQEVAPISDGNTNSPKPADKNAEPEHAEPAAETPHGLLMRKAAEAKAALLEARAGVSFAEWWREVRWTFFVCRGLWMNRPALRDRAILTTSIRAAQKDTDQRSDGRFYVGVAPPREALVEAFDQLRKRRYLRIGDRARKRRHAAAKLLLESTQQDAASLQVPGVAAGDAPLLQIPLLQTTAAPAAPVDADTIDATPAAAPTVLESDTSESGSDASTVLAHPEPSGASEQDAACYMASCGGLVEGYHVNAPWALLAEGLFTIACAVATGAAVTTAEDDAFQPMAEHAGCIAACGAVGAGFAWFVSKPTSFVDFWGTIAANAALFGAGVAAAYQIDFNADLESRRELRGGVATTDPMDRIAATVAVYLSLASAAAATVLAVSRLVLWFGDALCDWASEKRRMELAKLEAESELAKKLAQEASAAALEAANVVAVAAKENAEATADNAVTSPRINPLDRGLRIAADLQLRPQRASEAGVSPKRNRLALLLSDDSPRRFY
jgi:hypothetical protein